MVMVDPADPFKGLKTQSSTGNWFGRFLCRRGYHSWMFLWMTDLRMPAMMWSGSVCTIGEKCRRPDCRLLRTRKNAKPPKRVKT